MLRIWRTGDADIDDCVALAATRYADLDVYSTQLWARNYIDNPQVSILRTQNAVCCVVYEVKFWAPRQMSSRMVFLAAREGAGVWDAYALCKAQFVLAKSRGCVDFILGTGTGIDLGPIARRLGMKDAGATYRMEF